MGRKIIMTGRNAKYVEHRGANATPTDDRDIRLEGEEAVYCEYAYPDAKEQDSQDQRQEDNPEQSEEELRLLTDNGEYVKCEVNLEERLSPVFYNNDENVRQFLREIKGMQANDITDMVNRWVKDKRISDYGNSRKGVLWEILNDAGLYTKSRQNWCRRVY
jgi:hypothetical protein